MEKLDVRQLQRGRAHERVCEAVPVPTPLVGHEKQDVRLHVADVGQVAEIDIKSEVADLISFKKRVESILLLAPVHHQMYL